MRTATDHMMRVDLRRHRARSLTARLLHLIDPYLADDVRRDDLADAMQHAFWQEGVEIVTDADRAAFGLPPRDELGWTADEFVALERRRLELMMKPLHTPISIPEIMTKK